MIGPPDDRHTVHVTDVIQGIVFQSVGKETDLWLLRSTVVLRCYFCFY